MSLKRKIAYAVATPVLLFFAIGVFLPSTGAVTREATIDAWPATLFALVEDARRAAAWSPWIAGADDVEITFSGPAAGAGAALQWAGGRPGSRRVMESEPGKRVVAHVELGGAQGTSVVDLEPVERGTRVRWRLELDFGNDLLARYRGVLQAGALTRDLDSGLAELGTLAENLPRADFGGLDVEKLTVESLPIAYRSARSRPEPALLSAAMGEAFFDLLAFISRHGLTEAGPPMSITRGFAGAELLFDAAIPVAGVTGDTPRSEQGIRIGHTYAGTAIRATHTGSYRELAGTHRKIAAWLAAYDVERNGDAWEVYVSDPARTGDTGRVTLVYYPVKPPPGQSW